MLSNHSNISNRYTHSSGHFRDVFFHGEVLVNDNAEVRDTVGRNDHGVAHSDLYDVDF